MALRPPGEAGPQDKVSYPSETLQSSPQPLAAFYTPFPPYGPYGNTVVAAEEDFQLQPFRQLAAGLSASPALPQFALRTAPPLLSPGLALQREPLYDLPWHGKLPPWYPFPHFPREPQHFPSSNREDTGATSEDVAHAGGRSDSGQCYGSEISIPPPPVDISLSPEGPKTSQVLPCFPCKRSEDGSKLQNREGKSAHRYHFTQEDLNLVLYGVIPSLEHPARLYHAASGFLVPTDVSESDSLPQTLDQDSLQLPEGLCLRRMLFGEVPHFGVFCCSPIAKGVRFGPFQGKVVNASEVKTYGDNSLMWEIFEHGRLSHFIDGKGGAGNWMSYVNCARFSKEQNLVAVQCQGQIFYESCKEIYQNQELLVWYGDCYEKFLDIPVSLLVTEQGKQASEESAEGYRCERCGKVFTYRYYRDKHLKYTPCVDKGDRKFPCSLCKRSFEKRDRLRIHILHVHEKHRPHKCSTCGKCFSQSSSLNKHMRVHSGDRPYQCVYCTKKFTASSILRTHIRQHSGEKPFKCKHCGKSFASHAAHDSHVRRSHREDEGCSCSICGKTFPDREALCTHMKFHEDC
ncbi:PR/SET domain 14 [Rhinolophus ferrumequinum]|uniref:PR domain zinc finger protein 14 n=1 Tax=Rhinolophus ferrumequinum TaxID=59479 RepID=A0A671EQ58_RHIFE|nr:PR domain zinc finger protein 14 [Rhinolophus ferrumequinum]KAF6323609.1 PR/SET domain 14 [Rhinolophus ferrumequinum]